jgi:hypothetical protein
MEKWLVDNMLWVGLGLGIFLLASKYAIVHIYKKLVALDADSRENNEIED